MKPVIVDASCTADKNATRSDTKMANDKLLRTDTTCATALTRTPDFAADVQQPVSQLATVRTSECPGRLVWSFVAISSMQVMADVVETIQKHSQFQL